MRKLIKYTLIPGVCCLLLGILISAVLFFGYRDEVMAHRDEFSINEDNFWNYFEVEEHFSVTRQGKHYDASETCESYYFAVPSDEEIHDICFEFAVGEIEITSGDCMELSVTDMFEGAIYSEVRNNTWYIYDSLTESGSVHSGYSPEIEICFPKGMNYDTIEIDVNAGVLRADSLCADEIDLSVDAGSIKVLSLTALKELNLNNGVGEMNIYDMHACNLTADNGVGAMNLSGSITGDNYITCGIGEVVVKLTDRSELDFDYSVDCGIGEVEVDGVCHTGTAEHSHHGRGHHDNTDYFKLDCGIGRIELDVSKN